MGCLDFDGIQVEVRNALACLLAKLDPRNHDSLGLGPGLNVIADRRALLMREIPENEEEIHSVLISKDCVHHVQYLLLAIFCQ
jgi:hypothetical protein